MSDQLNLFSLPVVSLEISWCDLLGGCPNDMPDDVRRARWQQWKELSADDPDGVTVWTDADGCKGCRHLDGDWCRYAQLPATVNPILTMRHGRIGMACMGAAYEASREAKRRKAHKKARGMRVRIENDELRRGLRR